MVTKADLGGPVDLDRVSRSMPSYVYEPEQFPALFYTVKKPRITFAIFSSGKVMGYGGQKVDAVIHEFAKLANQLKAAGDLCTKVSPPEVCMLVASGTISPSLDIAGLSYKLPGIIYEPEQFPALIWHFSESIVVLLFSSGKLTITGAKTVKELNFIYDTVIRRLQSEHGFPADRPLDIDE